MKSPICSLFAHGGPGLNSFAEQAILGPLAERAGIPIVFWNEPSRLRPDRDAYDSQHPYAGWVASLEKATLELAAERGPINLIAHSFAGGPAVVLAAKHPRSIGSLTLIATAFDPWAAAIRIMGLARSDFVAAGEPESSERMASYIDATRELGDEAMVLGLLEALKDPELFTHYYFDRTRMNQAFGALAAAGPKAGADLDAFAGIFRDMKASGVARRQIPVLDLPVLRLLGENEKVIDLEREEDLHARYLTRQQSQRLEDAAHFVHLDRPDAFLERLLLFLEHISRDR